MKRFSIIVKDNKNNKEKIVESFEDMGWIGVSLVDETESISFEDFYSIVQQHIDNWEEK